LGKSVHPNRPGKKQISDFGLLPIVITILGASMMQAA